MIYYRTEWTQLVKKRKGPKAGQIVKERKEYETKSLTEMHTHISETFKGAKTLRCDDSVKWPFGVFAEVIAKS